MEPSPWSLLPPVIAILLALATRRVIVPLSSGILAGAILVGWQNPWLASDGVGATLFAAAQDAVFSPSHQQAFAFSILLGAMVGVLEHGGAMAALIGCFARRVASRLGAQRLIALSGMAIFFDDYANTLLVGGTMRPTADRFGVSREKLAYLVDSTSAPIAGLSLVSTWAAIEISYMSDGLAAAGIDSPSAGFEMFVRSIPYRFYPILALVMVAAVAITGRDFGPMRSCEARAQSRRSTSTTPMSSNGQDAGSPPDDGGDSADDRDVKDDGPQVVDGDAGPTQLWHAAAAVVPVAVCLVVVMGVLVATGIQNAGESLGLAQGTFEAAGIVLGNGDSYLGLVIGGGMGLVVAWMLHRRWVGQSEPQLAYAAFRGGKQMMPAMVILWLAWALSDLTEQLGTGEYLAGMLSTGLSPTLLPTLVFVTAGAVAFSTGTSWATMGLLTPLSIELAIEMDPASNPGGALALSTCGAVLAGAIFGDHCSPISDTTVLSSRSSGCDHIAHVRTQMPYALLVAGISILLGILPASLGISPWIAMVLAAGAIVLMLVLLGRRPGDGDARHR